MPAYLTVTKEESNQKLMNFLQRRFDLSNAEIQKLARKSEIRINNKKSEPFDRVQENDEIRVPPFVLYREKQKNTDKNIYAERVDSSLALDIIYEDEELLVIAKPYGLSVQGGTKLENSLVTILNNMYQNSSFMPTIAHRLDKDTSGLMLIAKSYDCLQELHTAFKEKSDSSLKKIYSARLVNNQNIQPLKEGLWEDYISIVKDEYGKEKSEIILGNNKEEAKLAQAKVKIIAECADYIDVEIDLITGRKHQIRAQCSHRKFPILGDVKYKGKSSHRLHLHATKIVWKGQEFYSKASWL